MTPSESLITLAMSRYREGASLRDVAREFGMSAFWWQKVLKVRGVVMRQQYAAPARGYIITLLKAGYTQSDVARRAGVSRQRVSQVARKMRADAAL